MNVLMKRRRDIFIILIYMLLPVVFHGMGVDIFNTALAPGDALISGYPNKIFSQTMDLWNPYNGLGATSTNGVSQMFYLLDIMKLIPNEFGYNLFIFMHYGIAGIFTYVFLKKQKIDEIPSFIGGLIFMFCGFLSAHKGHQSMLTAAVWLPVILYFIERYFDNKKKKNLVLAGIMYSMVFYADYPAMIMYIGMVIFPYVMFKVFTNHERSLKYKLKDWIIITKIILGIAILLSLPYLLIMLEVMKFSTRTNISYADFTVYSFNLKYFPTLLFSRFLSDIYPLTEVMGYMGILSMIFSCIAIVAFRKKNKAIWFWGVVAIIGFVLVLGNTTPLYRAMYHVPIYNKFRVPGRNWFEVDFAIAILAAYGIHYLMQVDKDRCFKLVKSAVIGATSIGILGVIGLVGINKIVPYIDQSKVNLDLEYIYEATKLNYPSNVFSLIVISLSIIILCLLHRYRENIVYWIFVGVIIFVDLFSFGHYHDIGYHSLDSNHEVYEFIKAREDNPDNTRTYAFNVSESVLQPTINMLAKINYINNYGPLQPKAYLDMTKLVASGTNVNNIAFIRNSKILSMISTKYIITSDPYYKELLENISVGGQTETENILQSNEEILIQSLDGVTPDVRELPIKLLPNADYKISFKAKVSDDISQNIYIDFYGGAEYDRGEQEIQTEISSNEYQEFHFSLNAGEIPVEDINIRLFTFGSKGVYIKDLSVEKLEDMTQYWGEKSGETTENYLYTKLRDIGDVSIYENNNFLPRARFITDIVNVENFEEAQNILWTDVNFDAKQSAIVENFSQEDLKPGTIIKENYNNDYIQIDVSTQDKGFLVLADTYYPGWKAYVDGQEVPIYKANGILRGIMIEGEGNHIVEFKYEPTFIILGFILSGGIFISLILYMLLENKIRKSKVKSLEV